jgi:hypothetical protein
MKYASFVVCPPEGVTVFDALNAMLGEGWRVERLDVLTEGRVTYAFLLAREGDDEEKKAEEEAEGPAQAEGETQECEDEDEDEAQEPEAEGEAEAEAHEGGQRVDRSGDFVDVIASRDDVRAVAQMYGYDFSDYDCARQYARHVELTGEALEMFKQAIRWDELRTSPNGRRLNEDLFSEAGGLARPGRVMTMTQTTFLFYRLDWLTEFLRNDEARMYKCALDIRRWLGEKGTREAWHAYLRTRAANPADVDKLAALRARDVNYEYALALDQIEDAILAGRSSISFELPALSAGAPSLKGEQR